MRIVPLNILFLVSNLFFCSGIYAQKPTGEKEKKGFFFENKGNESFNNNNVDSAIYYYKIASEKYEQAKERASYVNVMNYLTYSLYDQKRRSEFDQYVFKTYEAANQYLEANDPNRIFALSNLNTYYYSMGNYKKSIEILKEVLKLNTENKASNLELAKGYANIGNAYRFSGDNQNAIAFLEKSFDIHQKAIPDDPNLAAVCQSMGRVFLSANQLDSAIYYFEKAEHLLQPVTLKSRLNNKKINNALTLAELWSEKGKHKKTRAYIKRAKQLKPNKYYLVQLQETIGKMHVSTGVYEKAVEAFSTGQALAKEYDKKNTPPLKSRRLINLAKAYTELEDYENALTTYQEALKTLSLDFNSDDFSKNPETDQLLSKSNALTILDEKASILYQYFLNTQQEENLFAAFNTYQSATELIRNIRKGIISTESKKALSEKTVAIYEGAIQCAWNLFKQTGDLKYKESAFSLAEGNKALLLLESINEQTAKGFAGIPDSLLEKEKDLKFNLAFLQNNLLEDKVKGSNVKEQEDQIFELQQQLDRLVSNFEKNYPRYFELKYQNKPIDLKTIQKKLAENNALIEYFVGEQAIYIFVVTANDLEVSIITDPALVYDAIRQLRPTLNTPPNSSNPKEAFIQFSSASYDLYSILLQSVLEQLPEEINSLTIIPDDQLNYIPFSVLLTMKANKNQPGYGLSKLNYLMEDYAINYHYSATLLHKSQQRKKQNYENNFIGFAPSFIDSKSVANRSCASDELYSLQCSEDEVKSISNLFNGVSYMNSGASKSVFKQEAATARIIHLATHACIDENNSNLNKIFLTDDFLSSYDLYNLELNAELAVLSACNTGSGELVKGEGVMNLARGFINAGCSSTLMSMWSVDDCATSDIMLRFYEGLELGMSKDQALKSAKISYLESVSKTKMHPYYWAAFVPFGEMEAIKIESSYSRLLYIFPIALLLILFIFVKNRKG